MIRWHELADEAVIGLAHAGAAAEARRFLGDTLAAEPGWSPPAGALDAYPRHARYVIHRDRAGIRGAILLVRGNADEGLPILDVWPELPLRGRRDVAELSVLALDRRARGRGLAFLPLAAETWRYCRQRGIVELWAELEPRTLAGYGRFGWPFEVAGPPREYWGALHYPCRLSLAAAEAAFVERAKRSSAYADAVRQALRGAGHRRWMGVAAGGNPVEKAERRRGRNARSVLSHRTAQSAMKRFYAQTAETSVRPSGSGFPSQN